MDIKLISLKAWIDGYIEAMTYETSEQELHKRIRCFGLDVHHKIAAIQKEFGSCEDEAE